MVYGMGHGSEHGGFGELLGCELGFERVECAVERFLQASNFGERNRHGEKGLEDI